MTAIRHATHWGAAQCQRRSEGVCTDCRTFLTDYQRNRRAEIKEAYIKELCAHLAAERQERQDGEAA